MDAAYTASEIAEQLAEAGHAFEEQAAEEALTELMNRGWVESSSRAGEVYYAYRRWIGFRR